MTALCGGGPSGALPGVNGVVSLTASGIAEFISIRLGLPAIADALAPLIGAIISIDINGYCSTDPPADPGITALDVANALLVPPGLDTFLAQKKIGQWFLANYWWSICHCTSTTTPAPPTPSNPGPVTTDPGNPVALQPICWQKTATWMATPFASGAPGFYDLTDTILPPGTYHSESGTVGGVIVSPKSVPLGAGTNLSMSTTIDGPIVGTTGAPGVQIFFMAWTNTGGVDTIDGLGIDYGTTGTSAQLSQPILPTTVNHLGVTPIRGWSLFVYNQDVVNHSGTVTISWNCTTPFQQQPCCAPDPILDGEIQQILQYLQAIYAAMELPLTSFAEGTVHAGLSGSGSFTIVPQAIALKVDMTTIQPWVRRSAGTPIRYWEAGDIVFTTPEGSYAQQSIRFDGQVFTVPALGQTVDYNIGDGIVATLTELLPGP